MTENGLHIFFCVLQEHVEAALQSQTDPISRYVCFLEFASMNFVIVVVVVVEEHGNLSPHVEGKTGLPPGIILQSCSDE